MKAFLFLIVSLTMIALMTTQVLAERSAQARSETQSLADDELADYKDHEICVDQARMAAIQFVRSSDSSFGHESLRAEKYFVASTEAAIIYYGVLVESGRTRLPVRIGLFTQDCQVALANFVGDDN